MEKTWAERFKEARGDLSQAEAGKELFGCSARTVQDWELGRREPPEWVKGLILSHLERKTAKK